MCANGWKCRTGARTCPRRGGCWSKASRTAGWQYTTYYTFEGWNANQSLGMLITRRMEDRGLMPLGFVANDYALAVWGLRPGGRSGGAALARYPGPMSSSNGCSNRYLLRRAFREVAVISGLVERQHPGKRKTGGR
jgi:ATP-dependent Lhr-like helicase